MDLLSMLNSDDSKPRSSSVSIAAIINDRPSKTPPPTAPAQPVKTSIDTDDNSSVPRKRQRVDDDEDDEDPSSQSPMLAKTPAREARGSISASSPVEERRESVAMPKVKQEDFVVPELEPTIKNVQPVDDLTKFISDFIFLNLNEAEVEHLEIEAKLGTIIDVNTNERVRLPVQTETVVMTDTSEFSFHTRFESNMTEKQHRNYNQYLNKAYADCRLHSNGTGPSKRRIPIEYKHTKQTDSIYSLPNENPRTAVKYRVSTSAQGDVLETIIKDNIGHLNIYSPRTPFDWRISINNERKVELPKGVELKNERRKDRMTYIHQHCQIDLTQVINPAEKEKSHELEVELSDIETLRKEAKNAQLGNTSRYGDLVQVFVDNVRLLARAGS